MIAFSGAAERITRFDVERAAASMRVELAVMRAVMAVESRNTGFDSKKRPTILFEPHVFYRNLHDKAQRDAAVKQGLAYPSWRRNYPKTSDGNYARLAAAMKINMEAAFRAISMGLGQVLGENFAMAGCSSAVEMFRQACESEGNQLRHMVSFIKDKGLDSYLRTKNWYRFALGYNGSGQPQKYAEWLEAAYLKWRRILSKPRQELDEQDLKDAGSKTIEAAETGKTVVKGVVVTGTTAGAVLDAATKGLEPVTQAVQTAQTAKTAWDWLAENWQFLAVVSLTILFLILCYLAYRAFHQVIEERVENARNSINVRF